MKLPIILILDIDQAIIGNVSSFEKEYRILKTLNDKKLLTTYQSFVDTYIKSIDIIRPYLLDFIAFMKKKYKKVEIFLYTNSTYERIEFLEPILRTKFKFKKIYTRRDSIIYQKNILAIFEDICKILKLNSHKKELLENNIIFIDDVPNNLGDYSNKQILCSEYKYKYYYDLQAKFLNTYNIDITKDDNNHILKEFNNNSVDYYDPQSNIYVISDLYLCNLNKLIKQRENELSKCDDFFFKLIEIIKKNKYKNFNDLTIEKINKQLLDNEKACCSN